MKRILLILFLLFGLTHQVLQAQQRSAAPPVLRAMLPAGTDTAFVYHTLTPPPGHGVLLYRSVDDGDEVLISQQPLLVSFDPAVVRERAGDAWPVLLEATRRDDALSAIIALRQDPFTANLLTFLSPEIAYVLGRRLIDPEPPEGRLVKYRVEVVNDLAEPTGDEIDATLTLMPILPEAPTGLELENLGANIRLKWNYPRMNRNDDDAVISFQASCLAESGGRTREIKPEPALRTMNTTSFTTSIPTPPVGSRVTCAVVPVTFAGSIGLPGNQVSLNIVDIEPLPVVGIPELEQVGGHGVRISWSIPADPRVSGYNLYRSELATDGFTKINPEPISPDQTFFEDRAPRDNSPWFYRITVVGPDEREGEMSAPEFLFVYDVTPPSAPFNFRATARDNHSVVLQWDDPTPAEDLWTYVVLRIRDNPISGPAWTQISHGNQLRSTRFIDDGEAGQGFYDGDFYRYAIVAVDSARNRSDTLYTRVQIPDLNAPEAPSRLTAGLADGYRVNLNWNASPDGDVVNYIVYRLEEGNSGFNERKRLTNEHQFLRDDLVTIGLTYTYQVTAVDSAGNESTPSPIASIFVEPSDVPANVRNIRATATNEGVELSWEPVRSAHTTGYRIYRSAISTGRYELMGETDLNITTWLDLTASDNEFWYKVYAVNVAGKESRLSDAAKIQN